jgi:transcriptional regulator with XRE-family HTH domain
VVIILNRIKLLREEFGLKQEDIAKILHVEVAAISKYETGRVPLKDEYIIILCNFFKVSSDYLLGLSNDRTSGTPSVNKEFSAFYENYKDLDEEHKTVLRTMLKAFVDSKKDDK